MVFSLIDNERKYYLLTEVDSSELAKKLEKISKEISTRLELQKEQRRVN
jgi:hypothetical protein